jgi:DNA polymerase III subunit epsilon
MRQIFLDTETTGLSPKAGHRIIEIGCIELIDRRVTGKTYHQYINPQRVVDAGAFKVHGLGNDFLDDYPVFAEIIAPFYQFIAGSELIIHNAPFDLGFINHEIKLYLQDQPEQQEQYPLIHGKKNIIDTLVLARNMHPGQKNNLDALCRRYDINASDRQLHGALLDADLLAKVYLAMTGGQIDLNLNAYAADAQQNKLVIDSNLDLPVIAPTATELQAHQQIMRQLATD